MYASSRNLNENPDNIIQDKSCGFVSHFLTGILDRKCLRQKIAFSMSFQSQNVNISRVTV